MRSQALRANVKTNALDDFAAKNLRIKIFSDNDVVDRYHEMIEALNQHFALLQIRLLRRLITTASPRCQVKKHSPQRARKTRRTSLAQRAQAKKIRNPNIENLS